MNEAAEFLKSSHFRWSMGVAVVAFIVIAIIIAGLSDDSPDAAPQQQAAPQQFAGAFGDGTYRVGQDIRPGTYQNSDSASGCYWKRLSGFSGESRDTIANGYEDSIQIVAIETSDTGFFADDCGTWRRID